MIDAIIFFRGRVDSPFHLFSSCEKITKSQLNLFFRLTLRIDKTSTWNISLFTLAFVYMIKKNPVKGASLFILRPSFIVSKLF